MNNSMLARKNVSTEKSKNMERFELELDQD